MKLLNEEVVTQLEQVFKNMKTDVTLALFTEEEVCETCKDADSFLTELSEASPKLHLKRYDLSKDVDLAKKYHVSMVPSIVLLDHQEVYNGIKFNGIPAGHEINSFVKGILEVSGAGNPLPDDVAQRLSKIKKPVNIKVFVTLGCPHCSGAVEKAHKLALMSPHVDAEMIEAQTFYDLSEKYNVSSVPKIVVNDEFEFVGNQSFEVFMEEIEKTQVSA